MSLLIRYPKFPDNNVLLVNIDSLVSIRQSLGGPSWSNTARVQYPTNGPIPVGSSMRRIDGKLFTYPYGANPTRFSKSTDNGFNFTVQSNQNYGVRGEICNLGNGVYVVGGPQDTNRRTTNDFTSLAIMTGMMGGVAVGCADLVSGYAIGIRQDLVLRSLNRGLNWSQIPSVNPALSMGNSGGQFAADYETGRMFFGGQVIGNTAPKIIHTNDGTSISTVPQPVSGAIYVSAILYSPRLKKLVVGLSDGKILFGDHTGLVLANSYFPINKAPICLVDSGTHLVAQGTDLLMYSLNGMDWFNCTVPFIVNSGNPAMVSLYDN